MVEGRRLDHFQFAQFSVHGACETRLGREDWNFPERIWHTTPRKQMVLYRILSILQDSIGFQ